MTDSSHDTVREQLEEYALGLLSPSVRDQVRAHSRECQDCASDLRELAQALEGIGRATEPTAPPAALRERVLTGLASTPQLRRHQPQRPEAGSRLRWTSPWLAAAAALVLLAGAVLVRSNQQVGRLTSALTDAQRHTRSLEERLKGFSEQADLAVSILTAGDMQPIRLAPPLPSETGTARAYWSPTRGLLLVADDLPIPPSGRVYQVWLIEGKSASPVSAGVLRDPEQRRGMLVVPPPPGVSADKVTVAVTDEPAGGLPAPSGSMLLVGSL